MLISIFNPLVFYCGQQILHGVRPCFSACSIVSSFIVPPQLLRPRQFFLLWYLFELEPVQMYTFCSSLRLCSTGTSALTDALIISAAISNSFFMILLF